MMNMAYGMEVMQTKDKITFFSELNDALRRVYLDGRKPTQKILDDPTYAGYSTGHWEGDTLVVDTVALNDLTFIEGFTPHSTAMTVKERIRFNSAGLLEDHIVVTDPIALTKPWEVTRTYRRASPGNDQLSEFACPEGLDPFGRNESRTNIFAWASRAGHRRISSSKFEPSPARNNKARAPCSPSSRAPASR